MTLDIKHVRHDSAAQRFGVAKATKRTQSKGHLNFTQHTECRRCNEGIEIRNRGLSGSITPNLKTW